MNPSLEYCYDMRDLELGDLLSFPKLYKQCTRNEDNNESNFYEANQYST